MMGFHQSSIGRVVREQVEFGHLWNGHVMKISAGVHFEVGQHVLDNGVVSEVAWMKGTPQVELPVHSGLNHACLNNHVIGSSPAPGAVGDELPGLQRIDSPSQSRRTGVIKSTTLRITQLLRVVAVLPEDGIRDDTHLGLDLFYCQKGSLRVGFQPFQ
jgi:hypothetical protein